MPQRRDPDPFAPVEGAVMLIVNLFLVMFTSFAAIMVFELVSGEESNVSFATIGAGYGCALVDNEVLSSTTDVPQREIRRDIASVHADQVEVCLTHPTLWQKTASALDPVGDVVFTIGGLLLIRRVIRGARRNGLFTDSTARRTRQLGWFMLLMTAAWPFAAAAGSGVVVAAAVQNRSWTDPLFRPDLPIALIVVSLGVLTFARVLRRAVYLQRDVDATI